MASNYSKKNRRAPRDIEKITHTANSGRIYFELLHLHPIRLSLTFTQEWLEWNPATEGLVIFQLIRGAASIANAPLTFTSFVVGHAFESPQSLLGIISAHYSSQLTSQILTILGSLAILKPHVDFLTNVGMGVRDFFYEPINGLVHGPAEFLEGLEVGTQSLARGVLIGVSRGAANMTEFFSHNLAELTNDDVFIDERNAHQKQLIEIMNLGASTRTILDSLNLAGDCVARGFKSGANGIVEQPTIYASRHGAMGLVKGIGKALVGALVKPMVGVGDAAVVVMNHVSEASGEKGNGIKMPKRLRRALPRASGYLKNNVLLLPYDELSAKAQKIVTGGETVDDAYIGHVQIPSHLIIASDLCLWTIDNQTRDPWCISWVEISHFGIVNGDSMRISVFSHEGLLTYIFKMPSMELADMFGLLSMQADKMGNCSQNASDLDSPAPSSGFDTLSYSSLPGLKSAQAGHVFGSNNKSYKINVGQLKDEIELIEQCYLRVNRMGSEHSNLFRCLDEEAWLLVNSWCHLFTGLSSRRCIAAGIINGTTTCIQIKSAKIVEGGSPCYTIPTKEYDELQGILQPGGALIFFGWGVVPSLLQAGRVHISIETNAFVCNLSDRIIRSTNAFALSDYQVGFLEKSYDSSGWWAKYWLLVKKQSIRPLLLC